MSCEVSVIIPVYNSSGTLRRSLDSVYSQSLPPQEILVVDDGSDDWEESKQIAASYPNNIPVHCIRCEKNQGASVARNAGLKASSCRFIAFLDSDDAWFTDKIEIQYGMMVRNKLDFSMHGYVADLRYVRSKAEDILTVEPRCFPLSSWKLLFKNHATPTVMILREKMVPFDPLFRRCEDWKCWMELFSNHGLKGVYIRHALAGGFKSAVGASGLTRDVNAMHVAKMLALERLLSEGSITLFQYLVGIVMETAIYPIRVLRVSLRRQALIYRPEAVGSSGQRC
jgi:glycosyltransferase involved in cell wall biosynthesis